jgi:MGT family glycosyltransferase
MSRPKLAFFCFPASGHVNPTLPVAGELVRRGVSVDYWATEAFRPAIEHVGARFRPLAVDVTQRLMGDTRGGLFLLGEVLLGATNEMLATLIDEVRDARCDAVVHDTMTPWGRLVAEAVGLPRVVTFPAFGFKPDALPLPPMPVLLMGAGGPTRLITNLRRLKKRAALARGLSERFGVSELSFANVLSNPSECNLVFTSSKMQGSEHALDRSFHHVGPSLATRPPDSDFPLARLHNRPVVYVSFGSVLESPVPLLRACIEAFRGEEELLVLVVGKGVDPAVLGPLPDNCIARQQVPQLDVLERSSVFITHAGMNSVNEALFHRVPLIVFPQVNDQFMIARRLTSLGVAERMSARDVRPDRVRDLVRRVLRDENMKRRVAEQSDALRAAGGAQRAAEIVIDFVEGKQAGSSTRYGDSSVIRPMAPERKSWMSASAAR